MLSIREYITPWEIHAMLVHFPIAFLLGAVAVDLWNRWRKTIDLERVATGLLLAGVLSGVATALAGVLAFRTIPAHTAEAHYLLFWHLLVQAGALNLFAAAVLLRLPTTFGRLSALSAPVTGLLAFILVSAETAGTRTLTYAHLAVQVTAVGALGWLAIGRRRTPTVGQPRSSTAVLVVSALTLLIGSGIGGYIVYHGGAGIEPELLRPELRRGHHSGQNTPHQDGHSDEENHRGGNT